MNARDAITQLVTVVNSSTPYTVAGLPLLLDQYRAEVLRKAADAIVAENDRMLWATKPGKHWAADLLRRMADEGTEKDTREGESTPALTVYRASHDSIVMGLYTTREAARAHCEAEACIGIVGDASLDWIEDEEDGVDEMTAWVGGEETWTGYVVTPLEVASEYNEGADA
jgi:hypothetical protein